MNPEFVPISAGRYVLVDAQDVEAVRQHRWTAQEGKAGCWYAYRSQSIGGRRRKIYLHRQLAGAPAGTKVDHWNGDGLDCRRHNLRVCTNQQNMQNIRRGRGRSAFKGVAWFKRDRRWRAYIVLDAKQQHLGYFDDEQTAARAYDAAAVRMFGEFANLNFA